MSNETKFAFIALISGVSIILVSFGVIAYQSYLDNQLQIVKIQHNCGK